VEDIGSKLQELQIARDVFQSAMNHAVGPRLRVTGVNAEYLPQQGVLVTMNVSQPWIDVDQFTERSIELGNEVQTLHDVPELVYEIMTELNMAIAPYDPELLGELRELREEQKVVRSAQRNLRSQLREARRSKNRAEDDAVELDEHIAELERELDALVDDYEALNSDIDSLYSQLQERRSQPQNASAAASIDEAVAETACRYGDTFRSLGADQFLNVAVRVADSTSFYAFQMTDVNACRRGDVGSQRLLEQAWSYQQPFNG
jgi:hypothetical protein